MKLSKAVTYEIKQKYLRDSVKPITLLKWGLASIFTGLFTGINQIFITLIIDQDIVYIGNHYIEVPYAYFNIAYNTIIGGSIHVVLVMISRLLNSFGTIILALFITIFTYELLKFFKDKIAYKKLIKSNNLVFKVGRVDKIRKNKRIKLDNKCYNPLLNNIDIIENEECTCILIGNRRYYFTDAMVNSIDLIDKHSKENPTVFNSNKKLITSYLVDRYIDEVNRRYGMWILRARIVLGALGISFILIKLKYLLYSEILYGYLLMVGMVFILDITTFYLYKYLISKGNYKVEEHLVDELKSSIEIDKHGNFKDVTYLMYANEKYKPLVDNLGVDDISNLDTERIQLINLYNDVNFYMTTKMEKYIIEKWDKAVMN